jgi:hypothetical protein
MELNGPLDQLELGARGERANVEQTNKKMAMWVWVSG